MKNSDFEKQLHDFLKPLRGPTHSKVQRLFPETTNGYGYTFRDALVYHDMMHGEKLAYLITAIYKDGQIEKVNYPDSGTSVSGSVDDTLKSILHVPEDEAKYKTYKRAKTNLIRVPEHVSLEQIQEAVKRATERSS